MTDKRTDTELSRAVAEKLPEWQYISAKTGGMTAGQTPYWKSPTGRKYGGYPRFANDWQLIGPEIEKRYRDYDWNMAFTAHAMDGETLRRAACLAILEE